MDVIIAGGGIIGCSIAWKLARKGLRVTVCESGTIGGQASSAAAGMLAPGGEVERPSEWSNRMVSSVAAYREFVDTLREDSGVSIDYRQCGSLELAFSAGEWGNLERRAEAQRGLHIRAEPMDLMELPRRLLAPGLRGAMHYPDDALVDPQDLMAALRAALVRRGAVIREGCEVRSLEVTDKCVKVGTAGDTHTALAAVLAAGAWSSRVVVRVRQDLTPIPSTFPVKGHLAGYPLSPGSLPWIVRYGHTYLAQRSSGFTIAGSNEERVGFDASVNQAAVNQIHRAASSLAPGLLPGRPERSWIGFRPALDGPPEVRRWHTSSLWLAYGHFRNGILLAPWTADTTASQILASLEKG